MKLKEFIAKRRIPKNTCYCYKLRKGKRNKDSWLDGYKIKPCPYYEMIDGDNETEPLIYHCKYLGLKDTYQGDTLLWDMVKECGINDYDE